MNFKARLSGAAKAFMLAGFLLPFQPMLGQETLLFKVTKENQTKPSYLYGTMHLSDESFNDCEDKLHTFLKQCDTFSGELDLSGIEPSPELAMSMIMLTPTLQSLYEPEDYKKVHDYLKKKFGDMTSGIERLKPFWIMSTAMQMEQGLNVSKDDVIDIKLQDAAEKAGLTIQPLETLKEQMAAIDAISLKEQAQMLLDSIESDEEDDMMEEIKTCYSKGDLSCLERVYNENKMEEGAEGALIVGRNGVMTERLEKMISDGKSVFCAVGALHLPGESGLINTLRSQGFKVEPVFYRPCN